MQAAPGFEPGYPPRHYEVDLHLASMDEHGIDAMVAAMAGLGDAAGLDIGLAVELTQLLKRSTRAQRDHPGRFFGLACLPLQAPDAPEVRLERQVRTIWSTGCTGKFLWPIPDRGLRRRLHRIEIPTLVLWGQEDDIMPSAYAHDFGAAISSAIVEVLPHAGHVIQVEQRDAVAERTLRFLDGG